MLRRSWPLLRAALLLISPLELVEIHGPDGQQYWVNANEISSLRQPIANDLKHFAPGTKCVVSTTNGKFLAAKETCQELRDRLSGGRLQ